MKMVLVKQRSVFGESLKSSNFMPGIRGRSLQIFETLIPFVTELGKTTLPVFTCPTRTHPHEAS